MSFIYFLQKFISTYLLAGEELERNPPKALYLLKNPIII